MALHGRNRAGFSHIWAAKSVLPKFIIYAFFWWCVCVCETTAIWRWPSNSHKCICNNFIPVCSYIIAHQSQIPARAIYLSFFVECPPHSYFYVFITSRSPSFSWWPFSYVIPAAIGCERHLSKLGEGHRNLPNLGESETWSLLIMAIWTYSKLLVSSSPVAVLCTGSSRELRIRNYIGHLVGHK